MCLFLSGHDKPVNSVGWSLNRQWWLSASEDSSLRVWTHSRAEPAIIVVNVPFSLSPKVLTVSAAYLV